MCTSLPIMSLDVAFRSIDGHHLFMWGHPDMFQHQARAKVNNIYPRDGIIAFKFLSSFLDVVHECRAQSKQFADFVFRVGLSMATPKRVGELWANRRNLKNPSSTLPA
ncbi:hypothetical protein L798_13606 [Zootermopsis nevadensis]|uniref:Uncharacterized protein n=1 Tax=Zootermopsis nevadensis TaxID=136037 RepID=A0A067QUC0_ZOONE|nr:hypothetical protein L798_13606 [Zootermopsis nevadensis]